MSPFGSRHTKGISMGNKKDRNEKQGKLHAMRVRLFQMLCALDGAGAMAQAEIESRLEPLFTDGAPAASTAPDGADDGNAGGEIADEENGLLPPVGSDEFRALCADASSLRARLDEIDDVITKHSSSWRLDRMSLVDRTAIRLAVYECVIDKRVPVGVAISEAVIIAKEFGSEESPRFVNGILAKVALAKG